MCRNKSYASFYRTLVCFLILLVFFLGIKKQLSANQDEAVLGGLLDMSLSDLMQTKFTNIATYTPTSFQIMPAAVTEITHRDIEVSGARSLNELLDIYVPGVQLVRHHWEGVHLGVRGIISDREDKLMIRVNGRVMNERTHIGAVSERNFPMLRDINHINVIRGAGSSLHGLGAVSMVIDIHTHNANTQPGSSISVRQGIEFQFSSVEGHFSKSFKNDINLYSYFAIAAVQGADPKDAPLFLANNATSILTGETIPLGHPFPTNVNDGRQFQNLPPIKFHLQIDRKDTSFWFRYTRAGETEPADIIVLASPPGGGFQRNALYSETGYQQFTAFLQHKHQVNDSLVLTGAVSFDSTEYLRNNLFKVFDLKDNSHREQEWYAKLIGNYKFQDNVNLALGGELFHETFGLKSLNKVFDTPSLSRLNFGDKWSSLTTSLLGEIQWGLVKDLTVFIGGRLDKNKYTDLLLSPRLSLVWSIDNSNTLKLIGTRSRRMNFAEENRAAELLTRPLGTNVPVIPNDQCPRPELFGSQKSATEKSDSAELRYEYTKNNFYSALSTYYIRLNAIAWDQSCFQSTRAGIQQQWGTEFELRKSQGRFSFNLSHAYTKLIDYDQNRNFNGELINTSITATPVVVDGQLISFGNNLNNWSNHITKLVINYQLNERVMFNTSLRVYWGFPGLQDFLNRSVLDPQDPLDRVSPNWKKADNMQAFLNIGGQYQLSKIAKVGLNFYNILGWFDKDLNKRIYGFSRGGGSYRSEATAAMLSVTVAY